MVVSIRDEEERVAVPNIPTKLSERGGSGFGLFLIGQIVDEVGMSWKNGMTIRIAMEFPNLN